jgi:hypothetical protein
LWHTATPPMYHPVICRAFDSAPLVRYVWEFWHYKSSLQDVHLERVRLCDVFGPTMVTHRWTLVLIAMGIGCKGPQWRLVDVSGPMATAQGSVRYVVDSNALSDAPCELAGPSNPALGEAVARFAAEVLIDPEECLVAAYVHHGHPTADVVPLMLHERLYPPRVAAFVDMREDIGIVSLYGNRKGVSWCAELKRLPEGEAIVALRRIGTVIAQVDPEQEALAYSGGASFGCLNSTHPGQPSPRAR